MSDRAATIRTSNRFAVLRAALNIGPVPAGRIDRERLDAAHDIVDDLQAVAEAADAVVPYLDANEVVPERERSVLINALYEVGLGAAVLSGGGETMTGRDRAERHIAVGHSESTAHETAALREQVESLLRERDDATDAVDRAWKAVIAEIDLRTAAEAQLVSVQTAAEEAAEWLSGLEATYAPKPCENDPEAPCFEAADEGDLEWPDDWCERCYVLRCTREALALFASRKQASE